MTRNINPVTGQSNDKSYKEAIVTAPSFKSAMQALEESSVTIAKMYANFIAGGMNEEYAQRLTDDFARPFIEAIYKGAGIER